MGEFRVREYVYRLLGVVDMLEGFWYGERLLNDPVAAMNDPPTLDDERWLELVASDDDLADWFDEC